MDTVTYWDDRTEPENRVIVGHLLNTSVARTLDQVAAADSSGKEQCVNTAHTMPQKPLLK